MAGKSDYVRVKEYGEVYVTKRRYVDQDTVIVDDDPVLTIKEICKVLDGEAESENYHSLVGLPGNMAKWLKEAGATKEVVHGFLMKLLDNGGLIR